ncbi:hypothetical protein ACFOLJ_01855 [Rugamonas sp. CCM 8940]|uniref:hypothetical protein n=1 Tax=Rugamonas sp. CCM 8940 TaxID=2765359 RepID=UPI0018F769E2|nr:hypothetical protein [Rugamonas sp. CCM 8940]MBJ7311687.1 hypothetical protein [Rugamonas sp. CCM 8940]
MRRLAVQRGQALAEFVVVALALVPLFLLMPVLGKYQDIAHATEMASRYVAFEAINNNGGMSSFKAPARLEDEVRRRFYSNSDAPIKSGDTAGDFMANQNLFWRDPQGGALIRRFSDVTVSFGSVQGADHAAAFSAAADKQPFTTFGLLDVPKRLQLEAPGVYTANVSVLLANLSDLGGSYASTYQQFSAINLSVTRHTSVLVDSWTAAGPAQVSGRIDDKLLFPGHMLRPFKAPLAVAVNLVEMPACLPGTCPKSKLPQIGELTFWEDVVPGDRLQ